MFFASPGSLETIIAHVTEVKHFAGRTHNSRSSRAQRSSLNISPSASVRLESRADQFHGIIKSIHGGVGGGLGGRVGTMELGKFPRRLRVRREPSKFSYFRAE